MLFRASISQAIEQNLLIISRSWLTGIMIQYIVLFKQPGIGYKVIVNGIVSHNDGRVFHDSVKINCLRVSLAWIYLVHHYTSYFSLRVNMI